MSDQKLKDITKVISKEVNRLNLVALVTLVFIFLLEGAAFYVVLNFVYQDRGGAGLLIPVLIVAFVILLIAAVLVFFIIDRFGTEVSRRTSLSVNKELHELRSTANRAKSLQAMASELRATLSFERVVEQALDVCSLALEETGIPRHSLVGAVFLFNGDRLAPVATRRFMSGDHEKTIEGKRGIVGAALAQAEPTVTNNPRQDPELQTFVALRSCLTAVCIPLRAGFQIFGAMIIGSDTAVKFNEEHFELFISVADQSVIALQNAQLYQRLESEKQRLIEADEEARRELARDLHDGPTQSIAAIAMRVNFIRSLLTRDTEQALAELEKVEELAKQTSREIRGMLFTLRPLVLETQGLGPAIATVIGRLRESDGMNIKLTGGDNGQLLNEQAQSVVFAIVEEALGNARKYARATEIDVKLWQEENLFVAQVQDNGVGFDLEDVSRDYSSRGSLGMINMRERAERIDGNCRVESIPGRGTTITIVVPLEKQGRRVAS